MPNKAAERFKKNTDKIFHAWKELVLIKLQAESHEEKLVLKDRMPEYLLQLEDVLMSGRFVQYKIPRAMTCCFDYSVGQLILEFHTLREVVFDILEEEEVLNRKEIELIICWVEQTILGATKEFHETIEHLKHVTSQLRFIANSVPIHLLHVDTEERFLFVNKAVEKLWGMSSQDMVGKKIQEIIGEETHNILHPYISRVLKGEDISLECPFHMPDGSIRTFLVTYSPLRDPDGVIRSFVISRTDINERKIIEEALRQTVADLGKERELRDSFVATLSHDLRTPLTSAKLSAQLLGRNPTNPEQVIKISGRIVENMDRADSMIRDILDAGRIKAGEKLPLSLQECDLNEVAHITVKELSTLYGERFVLNTSDPIKGFWDCKAIRRAIENLANNAVKYGSEESPITVSVNKKDDLIEIAVHNKGNPIRKEDQKNIFEQYHRLESADRSPKKGWGIGLTLVKGLAESHGGKASVRSSENEGTTFSISIPLNADGKRYGPIIKEESRDY